MKYLVGKKELLSSLVNLFQPWHLREQNSDKENKDQEFLMLSNQKSVIMCLWTNIS